MMSLIWLFLVSQPAAEAASTPETMESAPALVQDLRSLDASILQRRMTRLYGEFGRDAESSWDVAVGGEKFVWTWKDGKWSCPQPPAGESESASAEATVLIDCQSSVPLSLLWWETPGKWLENYVQFERVDFLLDEKERATGKPVSSETFGGLLQAEGIVDQERFEVLFGEGEVDLSVDEEEDAEPFLLGGKRLALEEWIWTRTDGKSIRVYNSLRNQWIERIDHEGAVEFIVAKRANQWSPPRPNRIILEKDGRRITFDKRK